MRRTGATILGCLLVAVAAGCRAESRSESGGNDVAGALAAARWMGGSAVDVSGEAPGLRALLFFDPRDPRAQRTARKLAEIRATHPDLVLVGATRATEPAAVDWFRAVTGFPGAIALDVAQSEVERFQADGAALRVIDREGRVVGRDMVSLLAHLDSGS